MEFMIFPVRASSFKEAMKMGVEVYHHLKFQFMFTESEWKVMYGLFLPNPEGSRYIDSEDWSPRYNRKIRLSNEDRGWCVGKRDVNQKATYFIAKFHSSHYAD